MLYLPSLPEIEAARARLNGRVLRTPLVPFYGDSGGQRIYLKLECLQPFGSFKIRAGLNALLSLSAADLAEGVLTTSAGNFGQGVAYAARELGVAATVVVPENAARNKINAMEALGARILPMPLGDWWHVLATRELPGQRGHFVHPVAEQTVLTGNATIGLEIAEDCPEAEVVLVPFGGGGLAVGIASALRHVLPAARVLVAESEAAEPVRAAFAANEPTRVPHHPSFIDGMGAAAVLPEMWPLVREVIKGSVTSTVAGVAEAIRLLAVKNHVMAEGAGGGALAAALTGKVDAKVIVCVVSGGNIDPEKYAQILAGQVPG
ncbi:threonine ammonia-lyase [Govanella unica]|uniref:Threonine/serine dehydratase n=1 Tax=Govanella unica TaxID=2975056 RepID=A0A9X3Z6X4_9PROT|nr:threonine/serine dehydratase [Govania unica]MDA5193473.1 threonine/serine dehydratase [Govania unica]